LGYKETAPIFAFLQIAAHHLRVVCCGKLTIFVKGDRMKTVISKSEQHERALMVNRLRRIEGQVRGISEMIVQGRSCEDVAQQMAATRRALEKAYLHMMSCSIMEAVADLSDESMTHAKRKELDRVIELGQKYA
jgi:CsoR family transcriptional regulator, copper-sensing transcriptional repressor